MRVLIISESFLPDVNGVANSVVRAAEHLLRRGHQPLVIAPEPASSRPRTVGPVHYPVMRVRSVPVPRYRSFRIGLPTRALADAVIGYAPDVVHLASPFVLGARGAELAERLRLPSIRAAYAGAARASVAGRSWAAIGDALIAHYRAVRGEPGELLESSEPVEPGSSQAYAGAVPTRG